MKGDESLIEALEDNEDIEAINEFQRNPQGTIPFELLQAISRGESAVSVFVKKSYAIRRDESGAITYLEVFEKRERLLAHPFLNKGAGFSLEEREKFELEGLLPLAIETIETQAMRVEEELRQRLTNFDKFLYVYDLYHRNETLFYYFVEKHLSDMMPIIYTPTVGEVVEKFSATFRRPKGLFLAYPERARLSKILKTLDKNSIDLIVVTDGERILGLGDQGVGGIHICLGKAMLYTLCARVNPTRILPIVLDVGTNNRRLLDDPLYLGWRHERVTGPAYEDFIETFVSSVRERFPTVLLHWEDFGRENAQKNLLKYQQTLCSFNDDIQGTSVVVTACLLSAIRLLKQSWREQRIVIFGAGAAGVGIADQVVRVMIDQGISEKEAREKFWLVGRNGLVTQASQTIPDYQKPYVREISEAMSGSLLAVIQHIRPTILIGTSAVLGAFTETVVRTMAGNVERPVILPLSNPTSKSEAHPQDIMNWSNGKALVATGSPYAPVIWNGQSYPVTQCNNALVFPGLGLGTVSVKAKMVTDNMLLAVCYALAEQAFTLNENEGLLPTFDNIQKISLHLAKAVAKKAISDQVAAVSDIDQAIREVQWAPEYYDFK